MFSAHDNVPHHYAGGVGRHATRASSWRDVCSSLEEGKIITGSSGEHLVRLGVSGG